MMRNTLVFFRTFTLPLLLTAGTLCAQDNAFRQPLPAFKYRPDNGIDTARQYLAAPVEALVTDSRGKLLLRQRFGQSGLDLNVSGLASGSYTLLLRSSEGSRSISFVVKKAQ